MTGERRVGNLGNAGEDIGSKANEEDRENEERGQKEWEQRRETRAEEESGLEFLRRATREI